MPLDPKFERGMTKFLGYSFSGCLILAVVFDKLWGAFLFTVIFFLSVFAIQVHDKWTAGRKHR